MQLALWLCWWVMAMGVLTQADRPPLPKPSPRQLYWQRKELIMFLHFGVNTFTGREWGLGNENPNIFQPVGLNTTQWVETAKNAGFKEMILVVKHHDGFFLYANPYTNHSVQYSSWRQGKGDVASDFVHSCQALDMDPAFYLSPWDRHYYNMTWKPSYNQFYAETESWLCKNYGQFYELWWDGANAVPNRTYLYEWQNFLDILRSNQPKAVGGGCGGWHGSQDCGPDTAWIGNEGGSAPEETWSWHEPSVEFPTKNNTPVWRPYFCDVSIRPGWFWHPQENTRLKTLSQLMDIYFASVGHNCNLQLNVPPNQHGLLEDGDVQRVQEFGNYVKETFAKNLAVGASVQASSSAPAHSPSSVLDGNIDTYWQAQDGGNSSSLTFTFSSDNQAMFNVILLQEFIPEGQCVAQHSVEAFSDGKWSNIAQGSTIGNKRLYRLSSPMLIPKQMRVTFSKTMYSYPPSISQFGLFVAKPINQTG